MMPKPRPPASPDEALPPEAASAGPRPVRRLVWVCLRSGLVTLAVLTLLAVGAVFAVLALTGRAIRLPDTIVTRIEARLNDSLPDPLAIDLTGVEVEVDGDWTPRLRLSGSRITKNGAALLTVPEARVVFDAAGFASGHLRPVDLRLSGAAIDLVRLPDGRIDAGFGGVLAGAPVTDLAAARAAIERALALPALAQLQVVTLDALAIRLTDRRTGRVWRVGDGRLGLAVAPGELSAELSFALTDAKTAATARLTVVADRRSRAARLSAEVAGVPAADLAAQVPPLAALTVLQAPISGRLDGGWDDRGRPLALSAALALGAGSLQPDPAAAAVPFDAASLTLAYDPATARITLRDGFLRAPALSARLSGHADLLDAAGDPVGLAGWPDQMIVQLQLAEAEVDMPGAFVAPLSFPSGTVDLRLRLQPFAADIGEATISAAGGVAVARGRVSADSRGWTVALDARIARIASDELLRVWPLTLVPRTRDWFAANVRAGTMEDMKAALRLSPGAPPQATFQTRFTDATVQVLRSLPPVTGAQGLAQLEDRAFAITLDTGQITPPEGGPVALAGSTFHIPDVRARPNRGEIRLRSDSTLTASLSLLNQPPFAFLDKAGRPVDLGEGRARLTSVLRLPIQPRVTLQDLTFDVAGEITGFASSRLAPNATVAADRLAVAVDNAGMALSGQGRVGALPFDATFRQPFAKGAAAAIDGQVTLSDEGLRSLGATLPPGLLGGTTTAAFTLDLPRGQQARLALTGTLAGARLAIPALGYAQGAGGDGRFLANVTLGAPPRVDRIEVELPGLSLSGGVRLAPGGGLIEAAFDRLVVGDWLDATAVITPGGAQLTGGSLDLRRMPAAERGGDGGQPFRLALDRLIVSDTIAFTGLRGEFGPSGGPGGGLGGRFRAAVNGEGAVAGSVVPIAGTSALRLQSDDAGTVLAAAGIFRAARGGVLDVTLVPQGARGTFDGRAAITGVRVQNANVLAALLNAVSVVGILEQLNGSGIVFNNVDVDFRLTPGAVEISRGAATGASLGVSMAGVYVPGEGPQGGRMDLQGVISPIYLVNGIGAMFTRAGEGVFGFTYRIAGPVDAPQISVNPLSILTPGMFREIFRRPAPTIGSGG